MTSKPEVKSRPNSQLRGREVGLWDMIIQNAHFSERDERVFGAAEIAHRNRIRYRKHRPRRAPIKYFQPGKAGF